jgi:hypothetical protein
LGDDDVLMIIYNKLLEDPFIAEHARGRIKFYEYPETGDVTRPYIVIDPLDVPLPSDYADDDWLTLDYMLQIDVWTKDRTLTRQLSYQTAEVLWDIGLRNYGGGVDEWDKDSGIFRQARRFRTKRYKN